MMYYINDGNYGSFLDGIIIKRKYYPKVLCCKTTSDSKEKFRDTSQYVSSSWEKKSSMGIYFGLKQFYTEIYFLDTNSFPIGWILDGYWIVFQVCSLGTNLWWSRCSCARHTRLPTPHAWHRGLVIFWGNGGLHQCHWNRLQWIP